MIAALKLFSNEKDDELALIWAETAAVIKSKEKKNWLPTIADNTELLRLDRNMAVLSIPSEFHKEIAEAEENKTGLLEYLRRKLPHITDISFEIVENKDAKNEEEMLRNAEKEQVLRRQRNMEQLIASKPASPKIVISGNFYENYKFDSFVVCDTNKKAFDLCLATAEMPQNSPSKILVVYGKSGVGKTHLLQAIGQFAYQEKTAKNIRYLSAIDFVADYVNCLKEGKNLTEFHAGFNDVDLFLIDDVHLFRSGQGQSGTQKAFFDILTLLYDSNKQIVITSDCTPADIPDMIESLKMRLSNSVAVEILAPSKKNRIQIIKKKLCGGDIHLSDDVLIYLADIPTTNIRELEGLYNRLLAASVFCNADLDLNSVKEILNNYIKDTRRITPDIILDRVCTYFAISTQEIRSSSRVKNIAYARAVAMYLIRTITGNSEQVIGNILGRDHSTVCITCKKVGKNLEDDEKLQKDLGLLTEIITGQRKI